MSADNGIYILKTPAPPIKDGNYYINQDGKFEYRVAHCQAIENIDYSDLYMPLLFGLAKVHEEENEAWKEGRQMYDEIMESDFPIVEYGISMISKDVYFPNMTPRAAAHALDCYKGAIPLDSRRFN